MPKGKPKSGKRKSSYTQTTEAKGDNTKYLSHAMHMWNWEKVDTSDPQKVSDRIAAYFNLCAEDDIKASVEGLAVAFGVNRISLYKYAHGQVKGIPAESVNTIKKAYDILTMQMALYMQNGKINPVAGIFLMKNNMDYEDKREVVVTPTINTDAEVSAEDLQKRYIAATEDSPLLAETPEEAVDAEVIEPSASTDTE